jgi:hypothetical protein
VIAFDLVLRALPECAGRMAGDLVDHLKTLP